MNDSQVIRRANGRVVVFRRRPLAQDDLEPAQAEAPVIDAVRRDGDLTFHCRYCGRDHYHGLGDGHRAAHCTVPDSPYRRTGYILREVSLGGSTERRHP